MADQSQRTKRPGLGLRVSTNVRRNSTRDTNAVQPVKPLINQPAILPDKENVYPILDIPKVSTNDKGKNIIKSPQLNRKKAGFPVKLIMENAANIRKELEAKPDWIDTYNRKALDESADDFDKDILLPATPPFGSVSPALVPSPVSSPVLSRFHLSLMDTLKSNMTESSMVHSPYPDSESFIWKIVDIPISDEEDF